MTSAILTPERLPQDATHPLPPDREWDRARLVRYLEDRFACAEACGDAARACARQAGEAEAGTGARRALTCVEICDRTARLLSGEPGTDPEEAELRFRLDWCREACLDCAARCAAVATPPSTTCAEACREAAEACARLLRTLGPIGS